MPELMPPQGLPITDDDATIAAALEAASIPTLMMSMIHMTGDTSLLDGERRPLGVYLNEVQGYMAPEDQQAVRAQALEIIKAYRDGGCKLPSAPDHATIQRMMSFMVAEEVGADYVPLMLDEMRLESTDPRAASFDDIDAAAREDFHVLIIGGGMSGVLAAIRLKQAGISFTVIEKNPSVGGTWYENQYPGCRVDVGNHFYCYSFEPNPGWTEYFARQPELQRYFEHCIDKFELREHFRFGAELVSANYQESSNRWQVTLDSGEQLESNALISAVGFLNRPKWPDIEGRDSFAGPSFHTAQWDHSVDLAGKRVAVIGTGATAFQLVPELAKSAAQVNVYQRTAPWMFPNENYHAAVPEGKKWLIEHLPYYAGWYRFLLFWPATDALHPNLKIDPDWEHQDRSINEVNDMVRQVFTDWITQQAGDDEELLAKVVPDYVPLSNRTLQDNGSWIGALKQDNVELVTEGIKQIVADGVELDSGELQQVDVVIFATGFHGNRFLWPMEITGQGGVKLSEQWGDEPEAYLGITVPNFPNMFCMYGPATNLAFAGSLIFNGECQASYIMGCVHELLSSGQASMSVKQSVCDDYNQRLQNAIGEMVWSHPSLKRSYYRSDSGKVTTLSPWKLLDYWRWTRAPALADYDFS